MNHRAEGRGKYYLVALVFLVVVPLLYMLGIGPAVWMVRNDYVNESTGHWLEFIYTPMIELANRSPWFASIMYAYVGLFVEMP